MTGRDRMVLIAVVVLAALGATWVLLVSPERQKATKLSAQVATAQSALTAAESQLSTARAAEASYPAAYATVVKLGKAVPASEEVPSLVYELSLATAEKNVEFASIATGASGTSSSASSASASASASAGGFTAMPFTFIFNGNFFALEHVFQKLDGFARRTTAGIDASGRLLTIQSVKLAPATSGSSTAPAGILAGTISATAYQLPASQGVTGSATPASPTGAATPASTTSSASPTPASATVKVNP